MSASHGGKGSGRRTEDKKRVESNWDLIKWPSDIRREEEAAAAEALKKGLTSK